MVNPFKNSRNDVNEEDDVPEEEDANGEWAELFAELFIGLFAGQAILTSCLWSTTIHSTLNKSSRTITTINE